MAQPAKPKPDQQPPASKFTSKRANIQSAKFSVTVGHGSVIHPYATITASCGPVFIGEYCIVEEGCVIENILEPLADGTKPTMQIGDRCWLKAKSVVRAASLAPGCRIMPFANVGCSSVLGEGVVVSPRCAVSAGAIVPASTIVLRSGDVTVWKSYERAPATDDAEIVETTRWLRKYLKEK